MVRSFSSSVCTAPDVMFRAVGDESVILDLKSEVYLGLNPTGTRMWTVVNTSASIQDAYELLLAEFEVESEQLRKDLDEFLEDLLSHGLILIDSGRP